MELSEVLLKRRSVRKYLDKPVDKELINELMHAAMSGPSACNKMPWDFFVVTNPDKLSALNKATNFTNVPAPLAIVVCGALTRALPMQYAPFWIQDCSAATENILLRATDLGLGSVWCGIHPKERDEAYVREVLGLTESQIPLNIIYIGYPAENPEPRDQYDAKRVYYIE